MDFKIARAMSLLCLLMLILAAATSAQDTAPLPIEKVLVPPGFQLQIFSDKVQNARSMTRSPEGVLFVGTRTAGIVWAVVDGNGDFKEDRSVKIAEGLNMPNGVAYRDGSLYVAEVNRILRYDNIVERLDNPPKPVVLNDTLPTERHHGWKFIDFGPDGKLYVPVGAPCNICERLDDDRFAALLRMNPDGSGLEVFAKGIRNTVGFDWHPVTGELWITDNGRDWLGDNLPPDELNRATEPGMHFGFPYCHGGFLPDPELGAKRSCQEFTAPAYNLAPHVAALGAEFYTGEMFPAEYRNQLFIAEHGSWNRRLPLGFRVMMARIQDNTRVVDYEVFAEGWLQGKEAWGRPVDLLQLPDGSLLISDDKAGAVYRMTYDAALAAEQAPRPRRGGE